MRLFLVIISLVLAAGLNLVYRSYQKGAYFTDRIFKLQCPKKKGIPCYGAVDLDVSPNNVVGFISMGILEELAKEEENAIRATLSDPAKKGRFGMIKLVEVSETVRGKGIGTRLLQYSIEQGRKTSDILALALQVDDGNAGAIKLYKRSGFVEVLHKYSLEHDLFSLFYERLQKDR
ncbi:hypothetical protein FOL47_000987 [Perkinsus chesapeaki]|uniref:N-acetyltransferase domain-containing protein n=1 Tax=Perkinsus chesapeaki TaxID=330153 RepID=A0A7J6MKZ6_PERCH|nr:hypothetical protein FOL47_000987 [Perkinsus chesapeaki]